MPPATKPSNEQINALAQRAQQLLASGKPHEAIQTLLPVFPFVQKMPKVLHIYAQATGRIGQRERCAEVYKTICKQTPSDAHIRTEYAVALARCGRYEQALEHMRKARVLAPHDTRAAVGEAEFLMDLSRNEEALAVLDGFVRQVPPGVLDSTALAHVCSARSRLSPGLVAPESIVDELVTFAENSEVRGTLRGLIAARAARLLDHLKRYDEAMRMTAFSKEIRAAAWDSYEHTQRTGAMIRAWTSETASKLPTARVDASGMIFIVGMPRSGTSLLEQMLARHPDIQAMGECNDLTLAAGHFQAPRSGQLPMVADFTRFAPETVQRVGEMAAAAILARREKDKLYTIDKQPFNFLHVPLIARILPGARVLHTLRDGRDTCISYHMQWFNGPHGQANSFDTLGRYFADYRRTMDAWAALPAPSQRPEMLDVSYEHLVADPERVLRGVMEFLGIAFDPVVLDARASDRVVATASRDQVKSEIYTTSVARWKRYEKHLGPFLKHAGEYFAD